MTGTHANGRGRNGRSRWTAAATMLAATVGSCGSATTESAPDLPECAAGLPVPDSVSVVEVTATPERENPTCAVTLASTASVDDVVDSWRTILDDGGVAHSANQQPGRHAVLRLEGPVCGSILIFAAGTDRVTEAVADDRTPVLASVTDCPPE